jgi:hypothetical protein
LANICRTFATFDIALKLFSFSNVNNRNKVNEYEG